MNQSDLRAKVIYEVFIRNHTPQGTFRAFENDLPRIRALGVDIIWFMPIHPIGLLSRKGGLGCPYSIRDYRGVNPEYGTLADFEHLVQAIHTQGMRVMIDVVYNHTAHDSILAKTHPEYFHQNSSGQLISTVPEWSDVIDLKYPHPGLTRYLIDCLIRWIDLGVDGFRCDVASLVPIEFWQQAREEVNRINPAVIWLAESVHAGFVAQRRRMGLATLADSELYRVFDLCYDYDIWPIFQAAVLDKVPVNRYLELLRFQESMYPGSALKLRCVENHDQARIQSLAPTDAQAFAWTAFEAFNSGPFLIYGGREASVRHTPNLFDKDPIEWGSYDRQIPLTNLLSLKKHNLIRNGQWTILAAEPVVQALWHTAGECLYGIFNVRGRSGKAPLHVADGEYADLLFGQPVRIMDGETDIPESAVIFTARTPEQIVPFYCDLIDYTPVND